MLTLKNAANKKYFDFPFFPAKRSAELKAKSLLDFWTRDAQKLTISEQKTKNKKTYVINRKKGKDFAGFMMKVQIESVDQQKMFYSSKIRL